MHLVSPYHRFFGPVCFLRVSIVHGVNIVIKAFRNLLLLVFSAFMTTQIVGIKFLEFNDTKLQHALNLK